MLARSLLLYSGMSNNNQNEGERMNAEKQEMLTAMAKTVLFLRAWANEPNTTKRAVQDNRRKAFADQAKWLQEEIVKASIEQLDCFPE
jgi:type I site-specific restriction-modification system R (restriction) subunit